MLNIKDHVITLVAVFLALGIGILIGTSFSDDLLINSQKEIIKQLEQQLQQVQDDKRVIGDKVLRIQQEKQYWDELEHYLYPCFIKNRLHEKNIIIISNSFNNQSEELIEFVRIAGGEPILLSFDEMRLENISPQISAMLSETSIDDLGKSLALLLVKDITGKQVKSIIPYLQKSDILYVKGNINGVPDAVLVLHDGDEMLDGLLELYTNIADKFTKEDIVIVGLSNSTKSKLLQKYYSMDICTIDNIDTFFGRLALIEVINGEKGHYGFRQEVSSVLPKLEGRDGS